MINTFLLLLDRNMCSFKRDLHLNDHSYIKAHKSTNISKTLLDRQTV